MESVMILQIAATNNLVSLGIALGPGNGSERGKRKWRGRNEASNSKMK